MVLIEKPPGLHFRTAEAVVALDFQPHPIDFQESWKGVERLAAAGGSLVKIWSFSLLPFVGTEPVGTEPFGATANRTTSNGTADVTYRDQDVNGDRKKRKVVVDSSNLSTPPPSRSPSSVPTPAPIGEVSHCQSRSRCVCILRDHTPGYLVGLRWSPSGHLLASCDSRQIILWEFVRFSHNLAPDPPQTASNGVSENIPDITQVERAPTSQIPDEVWKTRQKMLDTQSDIFDLCWSGDDRLITGGVDCLKIWSIEERSVVQVIRYSEGFVKGVCCHGRRFIAAQSNEKRVVVWAKSKPSQAPTLDPSKTVSTPDPLKTVSTPDPSKTVSTPDPLKTISIPDASKTATGGFQVSIDETELFAHGPNDLPYNRRGSFDPAGKVVAFPFGQKGKSSFFGVAFSLDASRSSVPFRFRGHVTRVNCVSFSRGVWTYVDSSASPDDPCPLSDIKFSLYVQSSVDGALSVWKFFYPSPSLASIPQIAAASDKSDPLIEQNPQTDHRIDQPVAKCFLALRPRLFDEQASATDMTWTPDGLCLAIAADDGTITVIVFDEKELHGTTLPNPRQWARVVEKPLPPRHPEAPLQIVSSSSLLKPAEQPRSFTVESRTQSLVQPTTVNGGARDEKARRRIVPTLISSNVSIADEMNIGDA